MFREFQLYYKFLYYYTGISKFHQQSNRCDAFDLCVSFWLPCFQNPREASSSGTRIFIFSLVNVSWVCPETPGQTKNDTDLKFGTHTPLPHTWKRVFCLPEKVALRAASLEKLPCHMNFPHISSIALYLLLYQTILICTPPLKPMTGVYYHAPYIRTFKDTPAAFSRNQYCTLLQVCALYTRL